MIQVRAPDGTVIRFPDGTPPAQINSVMGAYHDARLRAASVPGAVRAVNNGFTANFMPEIDAAGAAAETAVHNAAAHLLGFKDSGYSAQQAYNAVRAAENNARQQFAEQHPILNAAGEIVGAVANPVSRVGAKFVQAGGGLLPTMARGALVGNATGAAYGAGASPGHRLEGAAVGGLIGAASGGALPVAAKVADAGAHAVSGTVRNVARAVGVAKPGAVARDRLAAALAKDVRAGVDPSANLAGYAGVSNPTLADLGGESLRAVVRDAGSQGPARQSLQAYRDQVASDLQDHALAITQRLTPGETRTPQQVEAALEALRDANATTKYAGPYAEPLGVTPDVAAALRDQEGAAAIDRAIAGARGRMDYDAVDALTRLKAAAQTPEGVPDGFPTTGQALDRIQIAFGRTGGQLASREGAGDLAAGQFKRRALINALLDSTPGLADARADFHNLSQQIDALADGGALTRASPSDFQETFGAASPDVLKAGQIGGRDALVTAIGNPVEGATGALRRLSTNTNTGQNMGLLYGPEAMQDWRNGIQAELGRMENANFMAPNTGSQTASRSQDLIAALMHGGHAVKSAISAILGGGPLSDAEREAIVTPAISPSDPDYLAKLLAAQRSPALFQASPYAIAPTAAVLSGAGR